MGLTVYDILWLQRLTVPWFRFQKKGRALALVRMEGKNPANSGASRVYLSAPAWEGAPGGECYPTNAVTDYRPFNL